MSENIILKAAQMAYQAHKGQLRKYNGSPYIEHPMRVAGRVSLSDGVPERVVAAAWLHDVREDCVDYWESHKNELPPEVIELVDWLTNTSKSGEFANLNRAARKELDRAKLSKAPYWVKIIKLFDRIDNLMEMSPKDSGFARLYCEESEALVRAISSNDPGDDIIAMCVVVAGYIQKLKDQISVENDKE